MKKLILSMIVACAAYVSQAAYLYWQVENNYSSSDFSYALYDRAQAGADTSTMVGFQNASEAVSVDDTNVLVFDIGDNVPYAYYVEIINFSNGVGDVWQRSQEVTYTELSENITYIADISPASPLAPTAFGGSYSGVPEPTSAMMILLGLAGLALKRKQV